MMVEPNFLALEHVLELHTRAIEVHGGMHGIRDRGLLESALAMPNAGFGGQYAHTTLYEMAAAYLFHLTMNHPFLDGNKRIGFAGAVVFLHMNGQVLNVSNREAEKMVLKVARGEMDKGDITKYFAAHCVAQPA